MADSGDDVAMEGTIGALLHAQPVDTTPEERKRSGRPCVGGRGEFWDALTSMLVHETEATTKNGLPGVPYALKHTVTALREVWTRYAPGVRLGVPPLDCVWLAAAADTLIHGIVTDVYLDPLDAVRYLDALMNVTTVLSRRTSQEWITDAHAPRAMFTPEVARKYATAAEAAAPRVLMPTACVRQNYVAWPDVERLYAAVHDLLTHAVARGVGPDAQRVLGWGRFVLACFMPYPGPGNGAPLHVTHGRDIVNDLHVWKPASSPPVAYVAGSSGGDDTDGADGAVTDVLDVAPSTARVPYLAVDVLRHTAVLHVPHGTSVHTLPLGGVAYDAAVWVWQQREGAVHRERLLPKRVTADVVLRRLCKHLEPYVHGRTLTSAGLYTAWTTAAFAQELELLHARVRTLQLAEVDPLAVLRSALYPATVAALPRLTFPGDAVAVTDLFPDPQ